MSTSVYKYFSAVTFISALHDLMTSASHLSHAHIYLADYSRHGPKDEIQLLRHGSKPETIQRYCRLQVSRNAQGYPGTRRC